MRKLFTFILVATIALSHSCTKSGIENDAMNGNKIKLSATQVEVDFEGETECKVIVNSPCSWEAESKIDWLNVVTKQGIAGTKELFFYADDNYDLKKREGTIVVTNRDYGYIDELYVTQKGFEPRIEYPESITFNSEGGTKYATISANFSYSYSENASWITCSRTNDGLKVVATESASTKERSAEITLYNENYKVEKIIKVAQKEFEPTLSVDKRELNFDAKGGSETVHVTTNAEFNVSESSSWISCTKSSNRVTITVSASDVTKERTAEVEIYLTDYNVTETVKISQKELVPEFEVKTLELNFEAEGGSQIVSVTANFDYSVSESAYWLSYEKISSGVKIIADANIGEQERTADVKIYNNNCGKSATIKVTQKFVPESYSLLYTSSDGKVVTPYSVNVFGVNIVSNTYQDGQGIIIFDGPITSIGNSAFEGRTSLTSITIPDSVTSIGYEAFYKCTSLKSITIPNSVTSIGSYAFYSCTSLTSITIPNSVTSIGREAFCGCAGELIVNCMIPSPSVDINGAFYGSYFTKVTIGDSVRVIGDYAFYKCTLLTSVTIGSSVHTIGLFAFEECTSLTSVTIGNSVTTIEGRTFDNCKSLRLVYCKPTTPPKVPYGSVFPSNTSGLKIYVPRNSVSAYKTATYWSDYASYIVGYDFE